MGCIVLILPAVELVIAFCSLLFFTFSEITLFKLSWLCFSRRDRLLKITLNSLTPGPDVTIMIVVNL